MNKGEDLRWQNVRSSDCQIAVARMLELSNNLNWTPSEFYIACRMITHFLEKQYGCVWLDEEKFTDRFKNFEAEWKIGCFDLLAVAGAKHAAANLSPLVDLHHVSQAPPGAVVILLQQDQPGGGLTNEINRPHHKGRAKALPLSYQNRLVVNHRRQQDLRNQINPWYQTFGINSTLGKLTQGRS
jgi:hypothetical protein